MSSNTTINDAALAAFIVRKTELDALLARIEAATADNFCVNPDRVTWGDVGSLDFVSQHLREIAEFLGV
jgi:SpoVK/Ycf46/Vps4 family AAA+-type ATPase